MWKTLSSHADANIVLNVSFPRFSIGSHYLLTLVECRETHCDLSIPHFIELCIVVWPSVDHFALVNIHGLWTLQLGKSGMISFI